MGWEIPLTLYPSELGTATDGRRNGGALSFSLSVTPARIGLWQCVNACRVSPRVLYLKQEVNSIARLF